MKEVEYAESLAKQEPQQRDVVSSGCVINTINIFPPLIYYVMLFDQRQLLPLGPQWTLLVYICSTREGPSKPRAVSSGALHPPTFPGRVTVLSQTGKIAFLGQVIRGTFASSNFSCSVSRQINYCNSFLELNLSLSWPPTNPGSRGQGCDPNLL